MPMIYVCMVTPLLTSEMSGLNLMLLLAQPHFIY